MEKSFITSGPGLKFTQKCTCSALQVRTTFRCIVTINVLWLFLTVPLVGLQYVIVVLPDHTHLLFNIT